MKDADLFAQQRPFGDRGRQLGSQRRVFAERFVERGGRRAEGHGER